MSAMQGNHAELSQPLNSVAETLTGDQLSNDVEKVTASSAHKENSSESSENLNPFLRYLLQDEYFYEGPDFFNMVGNLTADQQSNPQPELGMEPQYCMAQTEDLNGTTESSIIKEDGNSDELPLPINYHHQQLNAERIAEKRVDCFEPNESHLDDEEGPSHRASCGHMESYRIQSLTSEENATHQLHQAGAYANGCSARRAAKRKTLTEDEEIQRKLRKREHDKKYRQDQKAELLRLQEKEKENRKFRQEIDSCLFNQSEQITSNDNGNQDVKTTLEKIKELEAGSRRLEQLKSKFKIGDIVEMENMLTRSKEMELEICKLIQMNSKFVSIEKIESIFNKFKGTNQYCMLESNFLAESSGTPQQMATDQFCHTYHQQMKSKYDGIDNGTTESENNNHLQKELPFFPESPGSLQEYRASQSLDLNSDSHNMCGILNSLDDVSGTMPNKRQHYDELIDKLMDENVRSDLDHESFKDLLFGERESFKKYVIPQSLVSTARNIFKDRGDIMSKSKFSVLTLQTPFILFCATIREMGDRKLEEVDEKVIWKWRNGFMDAKLLGGDVKFAMDHLETIVQGYFGHNIARNDSCKQRKESLKKREEDLKKELESISEELEQFKFFQEAADRFLGKSVGIIMSTELPQVSQSTQDSSMKTTSNINLVSSPSPKMCSDS